MNTKLSRWAARAASPASVPIPKFAHLAARSEANFGIEGHSQTYDSCAALNPKFATRLAARLGELRVRGTSPRLAHGSAAKLPQLVTRSRRTAITGNEAMSISFNCG